MLLSRHDFGAKAILGKLGQYFVLINRYHFDVKSILGKIGAHFAL